MHLDSDGVLVNILKQVEAIIMMLKEAVGMVSPTVLPMVKQIKRGCMKGAMKRRRCLRGCKQL